MKFCDLHCLRLMYLKCYGLWKNDPMWVGGYFNGDVKDIRCVGIYCKKVHIAKKIQ